MIIRCKTFEQARKEIRKEIQKDLGGKIILSSDDNELNRKVLEKEKIDILLLNVAKRKDKAKQRDSGFNHVLAKLAKKGNVTIGINLDEILSTKTGGAKAQILARVRQNIK